MSETQVISSGYKPRALQMEMHLMRKRFNVFVCHRRFGKTVFAINDMVDMALRNMLKNPQYGYFAPYHGQAKRVAWEYLKDATKVIPGVVYNEAELRCTIPRPERGDKITIYLLGADNPAAILGLYFDGIILDEYGEMSPEVWSRILRPTLSDRKGYAIFIGTVKGSNHFFDVYQIAQANKSGEWYSRLFKASETGIIPDSELNELRLTMSEEEYNQELECDWSAALIGSYYGKLMNQLDAAKQICRVPYEPSIPVQTSWDLGISDTTVIWCFQQVGREIRAIDYIEESGQGLAYYANELRKRGYSYSEHHLPHDVVVRDMSTGKSRLEMLRSLQVQPVKIVAKLSIEDRIEATRMMLPKVWFDRDKCERGINALRNYERKYDSKNKVFMNVPLHNWASNGADAFGYFAIGHRDDTKKRDASTLPRQTESDYDIFG